VYEFEVKKISCGHCVATVTRAIQTKDPKAKVNVDLATKRVSIKSDVAESDLRRALAAADYPVT
jgi:copper chaperone